MSSLEIRYGAVLRRRRPVLEAGRISVRLPAAVAVAGVNGSGKSSLFMQLADTLLARTPTSVLVHGRTATLAYVPQTAALPEWIRAPELAEAFALDWRFLVASMPQLALQEIALVRLGRLSPGQRQAVALAIALARRADLLLLDEPFAALDFRRRAGALQLLREHVAAGRSLLLATPSAADFVALCNHLLVLHRGRCVFNGSLSELSSSRDVADVEHELLRLLR